MGSEERPHFTASDDLEGPLAQAEEMVEPSVAKLDLDSAPRPAGLSASRWYVLIVVLGGLTAFGPFAIDMYLPAFPEITQELATSASGVQLSLTACLAGLAVGQLLIGPLSDQLGRRLPLLVGVAGFVVSSAAIGFAQSLPVFIGLRFVQGIMGAAGVVVARAVVRDLYSGVAAARFFSHLMIVTGLAPIFAPLIGAQVMAVAGWRWVFGVLALIGAVLWLGVTVGVPETWPRERRTVGGVRPVLASMAQLARDRALMGYALASGLAFAALFAYISGSSFVIQNIYDASPRAFSLIFGANAFGVAFFGQVNGRLVERYSPERLLRVGLTAMFAAGVALLAVVAAGLPQLAAFLAPLFVVVGGMGLVIPNATALALTLHPEAAGSASALLGVLQFAVGAAVAPLVGIAGEETALPMALIIAACATGAWLVLGLTSRRVRS